MVVGTETSDRWTDHAPRRRRQFCVFFFFHQDFMLGTGGETPTHGQRVCMRKLSQSLNFFMTSVAQSLKPSSHAFTKKF